MRGVKQFVMLEAAQCTLLPIGVYHALAKCRLMDAALYNRGDICTSNIGYRILGHWGHVDPGFECQ